MKYANNIAAKMSGSVGLDPDPLIGVACRAYLASKDRSIAVWSTTGMVVTSAFVAFSAFVLGRASVITR